MKYKTERFGRCLWLIVLSFIICHLSFSVSACSESDDETADEYGNWEARNEAFVLTLQDSVSRGGSQWKKLKSFSKDENTAGLSSEYIYVKVLEEGDAQESPFYTDTVRVSYRGRLIPTVSYPEGLVFDQTYTGTFRWETTGVAKGVVAGYVDGFTTALLNMRPGDRWRVYIPYQLGYNLTAKTNVPVYSTLVFDLAMIQFWHPGEHVQAWSARAIGFAD